MVTGMDIRDVADAVQTGVGNTLGNVDRGFGAVFGEDPTWDDWMDHWKTNHCPIWFHSLH
ncbi:hypothetical protein [Peribacillus frigoritolerans]|uniref:hypothetical protein n=1 Tax=Peribacillus frigoritolerans TaxID=450367 RepID=UPI0021FBBEFA|nr:hypothetical protein [Peribacillus frigoritolerans]USK77659.1 hypothetical protein LIT31_25280 [Peribacillus frigoritolerans]